jgi:hypothetical protein
MPNATEPKGSYPCDSDDGGDKYDNEADSITATDGPILRTTAKYSVNDMFIAEKAAVLIEKHRQEFMKRAFSVRTLATDRGCTGEFAKKKIFSKTFSPQYNAVDMVCRMNIHHERF